MLYYYFTAIKVHMARLGQHFMADRQVLDRVVEAARLRPGEKILEVGPGHGELTGLLLETCSVTAIEKDNMLFKEIKERFPRATVINADALKVRWPPFDKCVSNLPYEISKKFLLKLLQHDFELVVLVLQREFAEKLAARPGSKEYGVVSVCAQYCCEVGLLDRIPKNAFKPQPKVESQIVRLKQRERLDKGFLDFVTLQFQRRNKRIGDRRVRDLSPQEFLSLYKNS
jgi:16S rRNA (adenine1518-N6/adenine1519-N6)-dimethyltransferase